MRSFIIQCLIVVTAVALLAELYLRATGKYATYTEANGGSYVSEYGKQLPTWYHTHKPYHHHTPNTIDFKYSYNINGLGIRDIDHTLNKQDSTYRILVLGDSYAEGVGAPADSTWPTLMAAYLSKAGYKNIELIVGAVAGSDPYFNYVYYRDKLSQYRPNLVIQAVTIYDYSDILMRGSMERFKPDSTTQFTNAPWYEPLYKYSRLLRALMHKLGGYELTGVFTSTKKYSKQLPLINQQLANLLIQEHTFAAHDSAQYVVLLHAMPHQKLFADKPITKLNSDALQQLAGLLAQQKIQVVDIQKPMLQYIADKPLQHYTYPHDLHYNPTGYNYMAMLIAELIVKKKLIGQ